MLLELGIILQLPLIYSGKFHKKFIENWSLYTLLDVEASPECGTISTTRGPRNIYPGYREVIVAHQTNPLMGTCGILSWRLMDINLRLMVMWSVPFNLNLRDTYYAIGMVFQKDRLTSGAYWFNQMYYGESTAYSRSKAGRQLSFSNSLLVVKGFMEAFTYHSVLNISVLPRRSEGLARSVQQKLHSKHKQAEFVVSLSAGNSNNPKPVLYAVLQIVSCVLLHAVFMSVRYL